MLKGWVYILECSDGSYYTGSTNNVERRLAQHRCGEGAKYTKNRRPVKLAYCEAFERVDEAFYREKQVQGWSRAKKKALIDGRFDDLPKLSASIPSTRDSTGSPTSSGNEVTEPIKVTSSGQRSSATKGSHAMVPELVGEHLGKAQQPPVEGLVPEPVEGKG